MKDVDKIESQYPREKIDAMLLSGLTAQFFSPYLFDVNKRANGAQDAKKTTTRWKTLKAKVKAHRNKQC
ncbi:hypothetical protein [Flavobacterium sp. W21_SRS_FM6]|uniref:hypothetical protein n=1 Tax=Flavobacterium sp. W21_SRS_FM6 TaxID=3240268 RepID=UPI003F91C92E